MRLPSIAAVQNWCLRAGEWVTEPTPPRRQTGFYAVTALGVAVAWAVHRARAGAPVFPVDDAYITLHNALVLRAGHDPNYPGVAPLVGATSAVHLVLVALFTLVLSPIEALGAVTWLGVLGWALSLARLAFVHRASVGRAGLLVLAGMLLARVPHQLLNGLETGLAMAGLAWSLAEAADPAPRRQWLVPALCALLPFLRPELVVASGLLLAARVAQTVRQTDGARAAVASAGRDLAVVLAVATPWMLWYWTSTGAPWPSTVGAKQAFFAEGCLPPATRWTLFSTALHAWSDSLGYFSRAVALLVATGLGWASLAFFGAFGWAYYTRFPGALWHYEQRYLYVTLPFLLYGVASCFPRRRWLAAAATALLVVAVDQSALEARARWAEHRANCRFTRTELAPLADWCNHHLPPGARILVHDAGYIAYGTRFELVDLVGLKTPPSVGFHQRYTVPTCGPGRGEAVHQIALRTHPDYLVVLRGWDGIYRLTISLRARGWRLDEVYGAGRQYVVYRLTPPV